MDNAPRLLEHIRWVHDIYFFKCGLIVGRSEVNDLLNGLEIKKNVMRITLKGKLMSPAPLVSIMIIQFSI